MSTTPMHTLPVDYKLQNYRILSVLGEGGFGITYLARDEALDQQVAIKEYYPASLTGRDQNTQAVHTLNQDADKIFQWGLDRFLSEARILARLSHPNIVRVLYFTSLNNTGYMVMQYEEGEPLDKWVKRYSGGRMSQNDIIALLDPITQALEVVHELGIAHRDVKPANIYIRSNGEPVLLDFGAARDTVGGRSQTVAAIVSQGYSPIEQYSGAAKQGPWTDIYATAAVAYRLILGIVPPDAPSRIDALHEGTNDPCKKLAELPLDGFDQRFLQGIDKALAIRASDRPQTIAAWRSELGLDGSAPAPAPVQDGDETVILDETVIYDRDAPRGQSTAAPARAERKRGGTGILLGGVGLAALAAAGWFGYQHLNAPDPDLIGDSFETGLKLGTLNSGKRSVSDTIGGSDMRDVARFKLNSDAIVDVNLESVPSGVELNIIDSKDRKHYPLRRNGRLSYKLARGEHALNVATVSPTMSEYKVALSATTVRAKPKDRSGSAKPDATVNFTQGSANGTSRHEDILWTKGEEYKVTLRVAEPKMLEISIKPQNAKSTLTLLDGQGLSIGRATGGKNLKARVEPGDYDLIATSRQSEPFSFELAMLHKTPEVPKAAVIPEKDVAAEVEVRKGQTKTQAETEARQQARARLVEGEDAPSKSGAESVKSLEKGVPFEENWNMKWAGEARLKADLSAQVRKIENPDAIDAKLSATEIAALEPFDVQITSKAEQDLNVGVYAWGADDSVVRIFPIGTGSQPIRLSAGGSAKLSDKVDKLVSAPLPGEDTSREAVLVVGCPEPEGFAQLAPAAGAAIEQSMEQATTYEKFTERLSQFCPAGLTVRVMPYTVKAAKK